MHVNAAYQVSVTREAALPTLPISALGLVTMLAYRTLAGSSPFCASEATDVSLFTLVLQVVNVYPIFPAGHSLVVVPARFFVPYPMGIAYI